MRLDLLKPTLKTLYITRMATFLEKLGSYIYQEIFKVFKYQYIRQIYEIISFKYKNSMFNVFRKYFKDFQIVRLSQTL